MSSSSAQQLAEMQDQLWIVVKVEDLSFAIKALDVKDMIAMPVVTRLPEGTPAVPGTINHRGDIVPLVDVRALLGRMPVQQVAEEFCELMTLREQDHRNWLEALETSVRERTPFTLATDPHQCAFGRWYDNYTTDDLVLQGLLRKFDAPHKAIHAVADEVKVFEAQEQFDSAFSLIEAVKEHELGLLIKLFDDVRQAARDQARRQVAIVLEMAGKQVAVSVDSVDAVEELASEVISPSSQIFPPQWACWIAAIGRRKKGEELALVLESQVFFDLAARVAS